MPSWLDTTVRMTEEPEVDYNPTTGEFEITWRLTDLPETSRVTILIPRDVIDRVSTRLREFMALIA